jgi:precorrin-3B synthase
LGRVIPEDKALDALVELSDWFAQGLTPERRRMAKVVADAPLPEAWAVEPPVPAASALQPGPDALGACVGVPFGQLEARTLLELLQASRADAMRVTPWRILMLEGVAAVSHPAFITRPGDPLSHMNACPGAPTCASATVETRTLARALANIGHAHLHVSGCAKGCAHAGKARTTLVGRDGLFDIVRDGAAWDRPSQTGLSPKDVIGALQP